MAIVALLTSAGEVWCWGKGGKGQLGNGEMVNYKTHPVQVKASRDDPDSNLSGVVYIAVGERFSCALTSENKIKCWGRGNAGKLGTGVQFNEIYPAVAIKLDRSNNAALSDQLIGLALGDEYGCALTSEGRVRCWGEGDSGKLGNGSNDDRWLPSNAIDGANSINHLNVGTYQRSYGCFIGGSECALDNTVLSLGTASPSSATAASIGVSGLAASATLALYSGDDCDSTSLIAADVANNATVMATGPGGRYSPVLLSTQRGWECFRVLQECSHLCGGHHPSRSGH